MLLRFLVDGESPDVGIMVKGSERIICPEALAKLLIARGLAEEITPPKPVIANVAKNKKEVKENG